MAHPGAVGEWSSREVEKGALLAGADFPDCRLKISTTRPDIPNPCHRGRGSDFPFPGIPGEPPRLQFNVILSEPPRLQFNVILSEPP